MSKSIELITNPTLRAEHMNRVELLGQVGELKRLPKAKYSTTKQVAEFYNVSNQTINNAVALNRHEIFNAGVKQYKYENIKNAFCEKGLVEEGMWNNFRSENGIAKNITNLFPKKAVLLVGFILDKSPVADKLRDIAIRQADLFEPNVETPIVAPTVVAPVIEQPKAELVVIEPVDIKPIQKQHNDMQSTGLIKTVVNESNEIIVSGRELHEFLEVKTQYTKWFERMCEYGFVENQDYVPVSQKSLSGGASGFKVILDHALKLDMAKEISMIQRNEKGKQARQYFINIEKEYKSQQLAPMASYMIGDPIERAKLWIQEEQQRMLLVETVETQVKVIEHKDEIIETQAQVISEQEQKIMKATAIMFEQQEMIADNINEKYARAYEMSRGYTPREMRNQINNMIQVNFPNSSKDGWNKLYNAYNVKYNVNVMQMKKDYEKKNHTSITIIEFVELDTIMISQLYDLALKLFGNKGAFEKYYK